MTLRSVPDALAYARAHSSSSSSYSSSPSGRALEEGSRPPADLVSELEQRGIDDAASLLGFASPEGIVGACRWFDAQNGRVGKGVLVNVIRAGGKPGWTPRTGGASIVDQQRGYAQSVCEWLRRNFPEFDRPVWGPHPAAVAVVIRLHGNGLKGALTKAEHGSVIRGAVERWEAENGKENVA